MEQHEYELLFAAEDSHWWFRAKRRFLTRMLGAADRGLTILDVGAGTGGTSRFLEQWGVVTRIESSPVAARFLRKRGLTFTRGNILTATLPEQYFDLITCLDVLYHANIPDDTAVLRRLYRTLKPGGRLLITDCALPWLMSRHDVRNHARERYTLRKMTEKLRTAGFSVTRSSYLFCLVFPLTLLARITERFSDRSDVNLPPIWLNELLDGVCTLEAALLRKVALPIGSSLIVVARRD